MEKPVTTSIRLRPELREALERRARRENRGKNWVISRALEQYLADEEGLELCREARRQSLLVARAEAPDDWTPAADFDQWR